MDIARNGIIMLVYIFVVILLYMFLSSPFDDMVTTFANINGSASDTHVEAAVTTSRTVFNIIFAALILVPIVWFITWVMHREPDWRL